MKNLSEDLRLRLSKSDMDFLRSLSDERNLSVSECIRAIIGEYRRSLESIQVIKAALNLSKEGELSHGDTETHIDNIV